MIELVTKADVERFWSKVDQSAGMFECWPWSAARHSRQGYGWFTLKRLGVPMIFAHRFAWMIANQRDIPDDGSYHGLCVCHTCDNPPCVNPHHLFLAPIKGNLEDMVSKGRSLRGKDHGMAKLMDQEIVEIREKYARGGVNQTDLGAQYGITHTMVSYIVRGKNWIDVGGPIKGVDYVRA